MKLNVAAVKSVVAMDLNLCSTDTTRICDYLNRAQERLLYEGKWVGTYARYKVCTHRRCITWPRQLETIEGLKICGAPMTLRNVWYDFLGYGCYGDVGRYRYGGNLPLGDDAIHDLGNVVLHRDLEGEDKVVRVYADVTESASAVINLQGYDENGNWVRTQVSGAWIDGENVAISTTPTNSVTVWRAPGPLAVRKPVTNGVVRLYSYDTGTTDQVDLAVYEPDETIPQYRRSRLPCLPNSCCGDDDAEDDECSNVPVEVIGKLRQIPVSADEDWLIIQHVEALRLACKAIKKEENNLQAEAIPLWAQAKQLLQKQLGHYLGDGAVPAMRMVGADCWGGGIRTLM